MTRQTTDVTDNGDEGCSHPYHQEHATRIQEHALSSGSVAAAVESKAVTTKTLVSISDVTTAINEHFLVT